jgi:hypothetical protein
LNLKSFLISSKRVPNVFFAAEINKWHNSEVQVLMKSWFISSRLILFVHSPFRVSINPSQPIREDKTDSTNNQSFKNLQNIKKWNPLKAQEFIESINVNNFNDLSEKLNSHLFFHLQ